MMCRRPSVLMAVFLCVQAVAVRAETTSQPQPAPQTSIKGPGTLSDKLGDSGGVIRPTGDVDPGMHKPAPVEHPNSTPVIPPPGTNGRPGAVPK